MRIPVNDNYSEKLLPYFPKAFSFLGKRRGSRRPGINGVFAERVRTDESKALVHCLAGVSRSATVAIAYVMQHLSLSSEEAFAFVKSRRPSVAPNFNFMGQLLEWEQELVRIQVAGSSGQRERGEEGEKERR